MSIRFYGTKKATTIGNSTAIFIDSAWDIKTGGMVNLAISMQDGSNPCLGTKKLCAMSRNSRVIYLDKAWGFRAGDWVNFSLEARA